MSESSVIPDGVDYNTAQIAIAWQITHYYSYAYEIEGDVKGNLMKTVKVFNAVLNCLQQGIDVNPEIFSEMEKLNG